MKDAKFKPQMFEVIYRLKPMLNAAASVGSFGSCRRLRWSSSWCNSVYRPRVQALLRFQQDGLKTRQESIRNVGCDM